MSSQINSDVRGKYNTHVCTHKVYDRGEATNQWERIGYSIND